MSNVIQCPNCGHQFQLTEDMSKPVNTQGGIKGSEKVMDEPEKKPQQQPPLDLAAIKLALEKWAAEKGYECLVKILSRTPKSYSIPWQSFKIDPKREGVLFLLRPFLREKFSKKRPYFSSNGERILREKRPVKRDYNHGVWASLSGIVHMYKCVGRGTVGKFHKYLSESELIQILDNEFPDLNRDDVFYAAIEDWLGRNKKVTSYIRYDDWENAGGPKIFSKPDEMVVPFDEWAIVNFHTKSMYQEQSLFLGVTSDGRLACFEPGYFALSPVGPIIENLTSASEVYRALTKLDQSISFTDWS